MQYIVLQSFPCAHSLGMGNFSKKTYSKDITKQTAQLHPLIKLYFCGKMTLPQLKT